MAGRRIDRAEVVKVARLAGLELGEGEIDALTIDLARVLDHFRSLERIDTRDVPFASEGLSAAAPLREDVVRPGLSRDEALANAPAHEDGAFVVPRILPSGKVGG